MAVSKRLRYEILRRDSHTCRYCGASAPDTPLRVDHVTPVALGGTDEPSNLATSCEPCNSGKTSSAPDAALVADVDEKALRWSDAMQQAAENLRRQQAPKDEYRDAFLAEWNRWYLGKDNDKKVPLPEDWKQAMDRFRVAGIPTWMWADIVDTGMANQKVKPENTFRYCCGIAWNKVTALQAEARRIVDDGTDEKDSAPLATALTSVAVEVWREESGKDLTAEQQSQLVAEVTAATDSELLTEEIIRAVRYAAWRNKLTIEAGLTYVEQDEQTVEAMRWENAWQTACGKYPTEEELTTYGEWRDALRKVGVTDLALANASAVAGFAHSCVPHFGIPQNLLEEAGINAKRQMAEDFWALAFVATASRWPTAEERNKFRAQLERLTIDGGYLIFDANAAAVAAGAAQEADLYWNVPRKFSALLAAASPLQGGEN